MTRSKQESTATIRLVNLVTKRDSVFMAFSFGIGPFHNPILTGGRRFFLILLGRGEWTPDDKVRTDVREVPMGSSDPCDPWFNLIRIWSTRDPLPLWLRLAALGSDLHNITRANRTQRHLRRRHQRLQISKAIARGDQHDHCDADRLQVLLMAQVLIDRYQHLEDLGDHQRQQRTVLRARPTHLGNRPDIMAGQLPARPAGHALVKQDSHEPPASVRRAATPPRLVHG